MARAQGIGEQLTLYPCEWTYHFLILIPGGGLNTGKVYGRYSDDPALTRPDNDKALYAIQNHDWMLLRASLGNVLTSVSETLCPQIKNAKEALMHSGAYGAFMTGSGNAVVGVYRSPEARDNAQTVLCANYACYSVRTRQKAIEIYS